MSGKTQDVQAKLDAAGAAIKLATSAPAKMVQQHGDDPANWSAGHLKDGFLGLAAVRDEIGQLVAPTAPPPASPPAAVGTGLALIAYGGTLSGRPHLTDRTYDVVVAGWSDAGLLATISKAGSKGFAYTVTTTGVVAGAGYIILDPLGNSGIAGALKPDDYIAKCAALKATHPDLHGIFLDNNVAMAKILPGGVTERQMVDVCAHVSAGLAAHGLRWLSNTGGYISGDNGSNDGSLWRSWAQAIESSFEYLLFENWQQSPVAVNGTYRRRLRGTDAWYKHWDDFQKCVGAVPGKFMAASYERGGDLMFGTYGRASMLTAPGTDPRNVFFAAVDYKHDPTGQPWMKASPSPKIDPVAGTASL